MKNSNLVPTPIVNANGVATIVYRKPQTNPTGTVPAVNAQPSKPLTTKAFITKAALALGTSQDTANRLAQKSEELDTDARAALLSLMKQDDPYGTAKTLLTDKFSKVLITYKDPDTRIFAAWVKHADKHLHAIHLLVRETDTSVTSHFLTNMITAGLQRYDEHHYTDEQLRDIALVTTAVSVVRSNEELDLDFDHELTDDDWDSPNPHRYLSSKIILDRITANHDTAIEALRLITDEQLITEATLLHRLDGHPRALTIGTL